MRSGAESSVGTHKIQAPQRHEGAKSSWEARERVVALLREGQGEKGEVAVDAARGGAKRGVAPRGRNTHEIQIP